MASFSTYLGLIVCLWVLAGVHACDLKCIDVPIEFVKEYSMVQWGYLYCDRSNHGFNSKYTWSKFFPSDGFRPATNDPTVKIDESGSVLNFNSFTYDVFVDDYLCEITNKGERYRPILFHILRPVINGTGRENELITYSSAEFSYLAINCTYQGDLIGPRFKFSWTKFVDGIPYKFPDDTGRVYMDVTGTLHFTPVLRTDQIVDGKIVTYRCDVSTETVTVFGNYAHIKVTPGEPRRMKPQLKYKSNDFNTTIYKEMVVLECVFYGDPKTKGTSYTWYAPDGTMITNGLFANYKLLYQGKRLIIKYVQACDQGTYYCQARNSFGASEKHPINMGAYCVDYI